VSVQLGGQLAAVGDKINLQPLAKGSTRKLRLERLQRRQLARLKQESRQQQH
jgi:hypothetical protein